MEAHKVTRFRSDVEGLRGIAVLLVVLYHVGIPIVRGGYVGVDVFFVLSGFLITRLLADEVSGSGRLDFARFYSRRARRLLPAASLVVLVTMVASLFVFSPASQDNIARTAQYAATYVSNFYFARQAIDYLGKSQELNPLLHMWSLSVEEQFYLAWPAIVVLAMRFAGRRGLFVALSGVTLSSLAFSLWLTPAAQPVAFFMAHSRAWEFALGGIASLRFTGAATSGLGKAAGIALGWTGIMLVVLASTLYTELTAFPGVAALLPAVGTAMTLVGATITPHSALTAFLSAAPLRFLGRVSYSWYLWHWPAITLTSVAMDTDALPVRLAAAVVSLGLALAMFKLLENPVRYHPRLTSSPAASLRLVGGATLAIAAVGVMWGAAIPRLAEVSGQEDLRRARMDLPAIYVNGCVVPEAETRPRACWYGSQTADTQIALVGDSHAAHWFPALHSIAEQQGWRLLVHSKSGCSIAFVTHVTTTGRPYWECEAWREAVLTELEQLRPNVVVVSTYAGRVDSTVTELASGMVDALEVLRATAERVVYIEDVPSPGFDMVECLADLSWWSWREFADDCAFERDEVVARQSWEPRVIARLTGIQYVSLVDVVCPSVRCLGVQGSVIVFRDRHHLAVEFVESLAPILQTRLEDPVALGNLAPH